MSREITMTINQYLEMERGTLTLNEIMRENDMESIAGKILANPQLKKFTITLIASLSFCAEAFAEEDAVSTACRKVGAATGNIIKILQFAIGKVCIIACILEIGKSLIAKRREEIPQIGMKYFIAYLIVKLIPWLFNLIDITF